MNPKEIEMTDEIVDAINDELAYQQSLAGTDRADTKDYGVEGQVITISRYARKLEDAWADNQGSEAALEVIRKIAGIACRALILYGCPKRKFS